MGSGFAIVDSGTQSSVEPIYSRAAFVNLIILLYTLNMYTFNESSEVNLALV